MLWLYSVFLIIIIIQKKLTNKYTKTLSRVGTIVAIASKKVLKQAGVLRDIKSK